VKFCTPFTTFDIVLDPVIFVQRQQAAMESFAESRRMMDLTFRTWMDARNAVADSCEGCLPQILLMKL